MIILRFNPGNSSSEANRHQSRSGLLRSSSVMLMAAFTLAACETLGQSKSTSTNYSSSSTTLCAPLSEKYQETIDFYFGLSIGEDPNGVSEADWQNFSSDHIAKAFPDGFSVYDLEGAGSEDGVLRTERSKRVSVILPKDQKNDLKIVRLSETYRTLFNQYSVLVNRYPSEAVLCKASE